MPGSGMSVAEATLRARAWWQEFRGAISRSFNEIKGEARIRAAGKAQAAGINAPAIVIRDPDERTMDNGIMDGRPWEDLTLYEQARVRDYWHANHVLAPEMGEKMLDITKVGQGRLSGTARRVGAKQRYGDQP